MNEQTIFTAVLELPPAERAAFLDEACVSDKPMRLRVEKLLSVHAGAGDFLDRPGGAVGLTIDEPIVERPGMLVGPYKLLEQIGEGGFGVVFMAEQQRPVQRRVAVKVIKPGMDTRQVIARFEAERQALALMDHPNIARVLDAGATDSGRPYFAMELVRGIPLNEFCEERRLTVAKQLQLFVTVCKAVQHAHQKGIIHRDIKPNNVLVTLHDGEPVAKVIDFGVAKATGQRLTEKTLFTSFAQMVGTPLYMSPEQAELSGLDIDTRSDIYSLGVLLYELLTGTTPFDKERLRTAGYDEVRRIIREEEPARPSARVSTLNRAITTVTADRKNDPNRPRAMFRGELDWIVMKALEKDRNRRYDSAAAFAADVQRYLDDEAVEACPPSVIYRLRKFARRNKAGMVTAAVIGLVVLLAVGSLTVSYLRIEKSLRHEQEAKQDLVQSLYYQWVSAAAHERTKNRHAHAEELLQQCPSDLRGWEWHYLKRRPFTDVRTLAHDDIINRVAWSPDGQLLASGGRKGGVKVWDVRNGAMVFQLQAQKGFVRGLVFSPDGRILASGGQDDAIKLWDVATDQLLRSFPIGPGTTIVQVLEFSPDGHFLAAAAQDRKVRLWSLADGSEILLSADLLATGGLAFAPDGRLITVSADGTVKILDPSARKVVAEFHADTRAAGYVVAFSRDRRLVALGCEDGTIKILRTDSLEEDRTLEAHTGEISGLAFGAGDERLASAGNDLTVKVWDLQTGMEALALDIIDRRANGLAFSPDGQLLAVGSANGVVQILDGTPLKGPGDAGQLLTLEGHSDAVTALEYSPDGRRVASASRDGTAKVWNADLGTEVLTFREHRAALTAVAWSRDGRRVASASWDGTARVWDATSGAEVFPSLDAHAGPVYGLVFNRDGTALATAHHDGSARVWDPATGKPIVCISHAHNLPVLGVAFNPSGERLASAGGGDNTIKVWDWRADITHPVQSLTAPENIVRNPAYSPDGKQLVAVVAMPARIWMWDTATGKGKPTPLPSTWKTSQALFTKTGQLAVVSSGRVEFLAADGADGPALVGCHSGEIECAAMSPDGRKLVTGAGYKGRGEVRIWNSSWWEDKGPKQAAQGVRTLKEALK